ncbi:hypothetical protein CRX72_14885 [Pantoea sp. BRM17]|nr:hypothetical protein CRX72_14885 [Pantoea sp. BRM17]
MKKKFYGIAALFGMLLLSGCNQLTQYTITEQEVNQALQKRNNFEKEIGVSGLFNLFPLLRSLTLVSGIDWPSRVTDYRDNMAKQTQVNLLSSIAA